MTDTETISALKAHGCDTAGALDRMMDDAAFYVECLRMFAVDEHFGKLAQAIAAGDADAAFKSAHALKGVAGNLGLGPLYLALCAIVEPNSCADSRKMMPSPIATM